ncbi:MAG: hypothetical protein ACOX2U_05000 [Limisphaerales bacterium]|jgi:hypothetical protein|nr:hypothetical protein [Verrucomicrobiota bacterium]
MQKLEIIEEIKPLLDRALSEIRRNDVLENSDTINRAIALFAQELQVCSQAGQVVLNSNRYGELIMYALHKNNYSLFSTVVELLQWHMLEQSSHTGFLWAMTVLLERINDLRLFRKTLNLELINQTLYEINNPPAKPKARAKTPAKAAAKATTKTATKKAVKKTAAKKTVAKKK